jgi:hypothetical protein
MSNGIQACETLADEVAAAGPEPEHGAKLLSPQLRAALEELDRQLQTFLKEHNSAERLS